MGYSYGGGTGLWRVLLHVVKRGDSEVKELTLTVATDLGEPDVRAACEQWAESPEGGGWRKAMVKHVSGPDRVSFRSLEIVYGPGQCGPDELARRAVGRLSDLRETETKPEPQAPADGGGGAWTNGLCVPRPTPRQAARGPRRTAGAAAEAGDRLGRQVSFAHARAFARKRGVKKSPTGGYVWFDDDVRALVEELTSKGRGER